MCNPDNRMFPSSSSLLILSAPFYKIMVPTVDTLRYNFLVKALVSEQHPVLLTGPVGTGKTSVAQSVLQGLDDKWAALTVNMSSQVCVLSEVSEFVVRFVVGFHNAKVKKIEKICL